MMPKVGDVLVNRAGDIRVVVVTEPIELTEADYLRGEIKYSIGTHISAAREAQDSPEPMPHYWEGVIQLPGAWTIVGREP